MNGAGTRQPTEARCRRARIALAFTLAVGVAQQLWRLLGIVLMGGLVSTDVNWTFYDVMSVVGMVVSLLTVIVSAVFFIQWLRSMTRNLEALNVIDINVSVSEVTWGWFVPLINLVYPYLGMRQIARHSAAPGERPGTLLVGLWWAAWIGGDVLRRIAIVMGHWDPTRAQWIDATAVSVFGGAGTLFAGVLALRMLTRFTREQNARFAAQELEA